MSVRDYCEAMLRRAGDHPVIIDGMYYGWFTDNTITSITQVTSDMLSASTVRAAELDKLIAQSIGNVPQGAWIIVLLPDTCSMSAYKDTGAGAPMPFDVNAAAPDTGANGYPVTIDDKPMLVYGELALADGIRYIYVK